MGPREWKKVVSFISYSFRFNAISFHCGRYGHKDTNSPTSGTLEVDSAPAEMEIGGKESDHRDIPANPSTLDPTRMNGKARPGMKPTFGPAQ